MSPITTQSSLLVLEGGYLLSRGRDMYTAVQFKHTRQRQVNTTMASSVPSTNMTSAFASCGLSKSLKDSSIAEPHHRLSNKMVFMYSLHLLNYDNIGIIKILGISQNA